MKKILVFFLVAFASYAYSVNTIVAIVNKTPITLNSAQINLNDPNSKDEKIKIINNYIDIFLQLQKATELNLTPAEKDIENISLLDEEDKDIFVEKNISEKVSPNKDLQIVRSKNIKNYSILGIIIVFIITFIALIIILDTFHEPISKIVPNIEFLLYNLYESINDIKLFLKDLI